MKKVLTSLQYLYTLKAFTGRRYLLILVILFCFGNVFLADAKPLKNIIADSLPSFIYSAPKPYIVGKSIPALSPQNSNVSSVPYSAPVIPITGIKHPRAVAVNEGNVYVLDSVDQKVYRILAGTTAPVAFSAGFTKGACFAVDLSGNVYIFDAADNEVVEKPYNGGSPHTILNYGSPVIAMAVVNNDNIYELITLGKNSSGQYQVSGTALNGSSSGFLITPGLVSPAGIAVDVLGQNVYVTDPGSNAVYKISTTSPYVKTLIYTDTNKPYGITVDYNGDVYVTDKATNNVVMIPAVGTPLTIAGGFNNPVSLSTDNFPDNFKSIYICDFGNTAIKKITRVGGFHVGNDFLVTPLPAGIKFNIATGVFSGEPTDTLPPTTFYVTGYSADTTTTSTVSIRVGSVPLPTLKYVHPAAYTKGVPITPLVPESGGVAALGYSTPVMNNLVSPQVDYPIVYDAAGNIFILDKGNNAIGEYPANGSAYHFLVTGVSEVSNATGIAIDSAKNLYMSTSLNGGEIIKYPQDGAGSPVTIITDFSVLSLSADSAGNLYTLSDGVEKIPAGSNTPITIASGFTAPDNMVLDPLGNVYVSDPTVGVIKISTVPPYTSSNIYTGNNNPYYVAVDGAGNVYISNTRGNRCLVMFPAGGSSPADTLLTKNLFNGFVKSDLKGNLFLSGPATTYRTGGYFLNAPLPQGLSFNSKTGVISGTPTAAAPAQTYSVTAYNGTGGTIANFVLHVAPGNGSAITLKANNGKLSPEFSEDIITYTDTVADEYESLTTTLSDQLTTATINDIPVASGSALPVQLQLGLNKINFKVVPGDGSAAETYTVNIIRTAANPVLNDDGLVVHQAITPNGDGINDVLIIDKIASYPDNRLMIVNNTGALVFEASGYDNKLKAFDGHSSMNGKLQPAGTYFYSLQYTVNGKSKTKTGYVVLKY